MFVCCVFMVLWWWFFVWLCLSLADEGSDSTDDEHEELRACQNVRGNTEIWGCFFFFATMSFVSCLNHDDADDARQEKNRRQSEHQEGFSGEWVWFVADGDDEDDERDQDSEADAGFVHVQLVLQRLPTSLLLTSSVSLVQAQRHGAENDGKNGNDGHDVNFDGRHFGILFLEGEEEEEEEEEEIKDVSKSRLSRRHGKLFVEDL